jgi:hypothetical protein
MARRLSLLEGMDVTCLERVTRDDHSEAGTGLNVGPNAVKALRAIDPDLAERITEASYRWDNWRISLTDGTVLFDLPLTKVADGPGWRIRWSELYRGCGKRPVTPSPMAARSLISAATRRLRARHRWHGRKTARRTGSTASIC